MTYILGKVFHKDGTTSDRTYLSYSAMNKWKSNKESYRARYYRGEPDHQNIEMLYGKFLAQHLEDGGKIKGLKLYDKSEEALHVKLGDVELKGYVDSFDTKKIRFIEIKSGHLDSKGNSPWSDLKVAKHSQLVWYYMMLRMKYGKCNPLCHLIWLETEFKVNSIEYAGHVLTGQSRDLQLTGKIQKFKRKIEEWEVKKLKKEILIAVQEIHEDYLNYKNQDE